MKVLFFAALRERLGCAQTEVDVALPASVAQVRNALITAFPQHAERLASGRSLAAVNQMLVQDDAAVNAGDEVAFFPPVTGG
ncbi:molybdopterin converting factor subunit 1 [Thalassolituus sp. LLYu03]|uniref:molybdopterin converting factor subunit 1 n=1 Tax=Thalassolituus sp. LLYu03 TaxID=3421656 RepID=UPI003D2B7091